MRFGRDGFPQPSALPGKRRGGHPPYPFSLAVVNLKSTWGTSMIRSGIPIVGARERFPTFEYSSQLQVLSPLSFRIDDATESHCASAVHAGSHQKELAVLVEPISLWEIPD